MLLALLLGELLALGGSQFRCPYSLLDGGGCLRSRNPQARKFTVERLEILKNSGNGFSKRLFRTLLAAHSCTLGLRPSSRVCGALTMKQRNS